jgi:hypothetical protein
VCFFQYRVEDQREITRAVSMVCRTTVVPTDKNSVPTDSGAFRLALQTIENRVRSSERIAQFMN